MSREGKARIIDRLGEVFSRCSVGILTDYRGLSASEINDLRQKLRGLGVEYRVVKNTLARIAAERIGRDDLVSLFKGPVAIAFGYSDITQPAKALAEYIRASKALNIKGGFLRDRSLTSEEVMVLSTVPSRETLLAKVVGGLQIPMVTLLSYLNAPVRGLMGVLQARIKQLEGG